MQPHVRQKREFLLTQKAHTHKSLNYLFSVRLLQPLAQRAESESRDSWGRQKEKCFINFTTNRHVFRFLCAKSSKEEFEGEFFAGELCFVCICDVYWYLRYFLASHSSAAAHTKKNNSLLHCLLSTKKWSWNKLLRKKQNWAPGESIWERDKMTSIFAILQINHLEWKRFGGVWLMTWSVIL